MDLGYGLGFGRFRVGEVIYMGLVRIVVGDLGFNYKYFGDRFGEGVN